MCRKTMVCESKDLRLTKCRRAMVGERAGADTLLGFHFTFSSQGRPISSEKETRYEHSYAS